MTTTSQNPLTRRAPSPEEYARLHHSVRSKAAWLLQDQAARLDEEMAHERIALEIRESKTQEALDGLRAKVDELGEERARLQRRRKNLQRDLKVLQSETEALEQLSAESQARKDAIAAQRAENQELARELKKTQAEAAALRGRAERALKTLKKRQDAVKYAPMSEEERRLFDAQNEADAVAARKRRQAAEARKVAEPQDVALAA